eukprot:scaffold167363_cov16-Tisochrysis_lutea.AAC.1
MCPCSEALPRRKLQELKAFENRSIAHKERQGGRIMAKLKPSAIWGLAVALSYEHENAYEREWLAVCPNRVKVMRASQHCQSVLLVDTPFTSRSKGWDLKLQV